MKTDRKHYGESISDTAIRLHVNVPNAFCVIRLIGSLGLIGMAIIDWPTVFLAVFLLLMLTDWIDGRLAAWLQQCTTFGARLDSIADAALYGALLFG